MPKRKYSLAINILTATTFEATPVGKVLSWLLTIGKAIVFITFFIIIAAFLYRAFVLDPQIEALTEEMEENVAYLKTLSSKEKEIRAFQTRLETLYTLTADKQSLVPILKNLQDCMPQKTTLTELNFNNKAIQFKGATQDDVAFTAFVKALKNQPTFSDISIEELTSGGLKDPTVQFKITITVSPKTQPNQTTNI